MMEGEEYKDTSCSYREAGGTDAVIEPMRSFTELSEAEQLDLLKSLIVSRELEGENPTGFLAQFRNLPNELVVKIWDYIPDLQIIDFRLVSKHWESLWQRFRHRCKKIRTLSVQRDVKGKLVLQAAGCNCTIRQIETDENVGCLRRALSFITFEPEYFNRHDRILVITGGAANEMILQELAAQKWTLRTVVFNGELYGLTEQILCDFLQAICAQICENSRLCLHFQDASLMPGVITDNVLGICGPKLTEFVVALNPSCIKNEPVVLTDRSLPYLFRYKMKVVIPACPNITIAGVTAALEVLCKPSQKEKFTDRFDNYYCPQLYIAITDALTVEKIAAIEISTNCLWIRKYPKWKGYTYGCSPYEGLKLESIPDFRAMELIWRVYRNHWGRCVIIIGENADICKYANSLATDVVSM